MGEITKDNKEPYLKFTPFYKKSILKKPRSLINNKTFNFIKDDKSLSLSSLNSIRPKANKFILVNGNHYEIFNNRISRIYRFSFS